MTKRLPSPPAPGPLEDYAVRFDDLFGSLAQRRGFREYLQGLLLPRDRNKALTALAGTEPIVGAQGAPAQRLQFFLSESAWDAEAVNARRLRMIREDPERRPREDGVLIIDETGERKDGTKTDHVGYQYLSSVGRIANGIVSVSSVWADERVYHPLDVEPYTPAKRLEKGRSDPAFRTKPQIAVELVQSARKAHIPFRAVVADCLYGENPDFEERTLEEESALRLESEAPQGKVGRTRGGAHPRGGCPEDGMELCAGAGSVEIHRTDLQGRSSRKMVGCGGHHPGWILSRGVRAPGGGEHRPADAASQQHMVLGDQPGRPGLSPGARRIPL